MKNKLVKFSDKKYIYYRNIRLSAPLK